MPPEPLIDLSKLDLNTVAVTRDEVYRILPHRYEFQQLDGIYFIDTDSSMLAGYRQVRADEFWVRGHIPGRAIFPGVLMIETAAQLVSYCAMVISRRDDFLGFGGVDDVKFRSEVGPGRKIVMVGKMLSVRRRRCVGATQAFVDGQMVFEGRITGMWM